MVPFHVLIQIFMLFPTCFSLRLLAPQSFYIHLAALLSFTFYHPQILPGI